MTQKLLNRMKTPTQQIYWLYLHADDKMKDMFFSLADIVINATKEVERVKELDLTQPEQIKELCDIVRNHEISDAWKKPSDK